jgi:hypothetical protein
VNVSGLYKRAKADSDPLELKLAVEEGRARMDEDVFNMSLRKFLKQVGVTSQREIETAVRDAVERGALTGRKALTARMTLTVEGVELEHVVESRIELE